MHSYYDVKYQYPINKVNSSSVVPASEFRTLTMVVLLERCKTLLLILMAKDLFINQAQVKMP
jgi:hypothetical protein